MSKQSCIPRVVLGALMVMVAGKAAAQCSVSLTNSQCYHLRGSDTLFDIMTTSIATAVSQGVLGANELAYDGSGSGNAEKQLAYDSGSGTPLTGATIPLGVQSIGPMSRNFRPTYIDAASAGFAAADGATSSKQGHAAWAPTCYNVVGLDAALVITPSSGAGSACKNLSFSTFVDNAISYDPTQRAVTNNTTLPTKFGNGSAFNNPSSTANYSSLLMVLLGGVDGSGTIAACSDPRRVEAAQDFANCMGVDHIEHIFRRDDNSGTTSTFQDRIITIASSADPRYPWIGGRFCNGISDGGINGTVAQQGVCSGSSYQPCGAYATYLNGLTGTGNNFPTTCTNSSETCNNGHCGVLCGQSGEAACAGTQACYYNLNNYDLDPIRRPCSAAVAGAVAPTTCTDMISGAPCLASDNNPNCTQGLVIALTDTDPDATDITNSISARISGDGSGRTIGYAGLEAVVPGKGTKGVSLNTISYAAPNVRTASYLMARRLFLQNTYQQAPPGTPPYPNSNANGTFDQPSDTAGPNIAFTGSGETGIGGGTSQLTAEQNLFAWMLPGSNHINIDPIVSKYFFVTCGTDPTVDPCGLSNNLCATSPAAPVAAALGNYLPNGAFGGSSGTLGAKTINSAGQQWNGSTAATITGCGTSLCVSGTCSSGSCPLATGRASNFACSQNSDCASGVCTDTLGLGEAPASLLCQ